MFETNSTFLLIFETRGSNCIVGDLVFMKWGFVNLLDWKYDSHAGISDESELI